MKKIALVAGLAAAVAGTASADVTVTFTNQTWTGFNFTDLTAAYGGFSGTLTGVSVNATLNATTSFTYADDLCVYLDSGPLSTGGAVQIGGFSNLLAGQRYFWPNGGSSAPGTTSIGTVNFTTALAFTGNRAVNGTIWIGNGYGATGTSGTWSGTITLHGVDVVPAPGVAGLAALAGLISRRRR